MCKGICIGICFGVLEVYNLALKELAVGVMLKIPHINAVYNLTHITCGSELVTLIAGGVKLFIKLKEYVKEHLVVFVEYLL